MDNTELYSALSNKISEEVRGVHVRVDKAIDNVSTMNRDVGSLSTKIDNVQENMNKFEMNTNKRFVGLHRVLDENKNDLSEVKVDVAMLSKDVNTLGAKVDKHCGDRSIHPLPSNQEEPPTEKTLLLKIKEHKWGAMASVCAAILMFLAYLFSQIV